MAKIGPITIEIEIEPVVKLTCLNDKCKYRSRKYTTCILKEVAIRETGSCLYQNYSEWVNHGD